MTFNFRLKRQIVWQRRKPHYVSPEVTDSVTLTSVAVVGLREMERIGGMAETGEMDVMEEERKATRTVCTAAVRWKKWRKWRRMGGRLLGSLPKEPLTSGRYALYVVYCLLCFC